MAVRPPKPETDPQALPAVAAEATRAQAAESTEASRAQTAEQANTAALNSHKADPAAHATLFAAKVSTFSLSSYEDRNVSVPSFTRANGGNPVFTAADATLNNPSGSIYWPWVFKVPASVSVPGSQRYRLYYSTNHDPSNGHLRCAFGPSPLGPWTDQGEIFRHVGTPGFETETPSVMFQPADPAGKPFYMYCQVASYPGAVGVQSTILVRSADGLTAWEELGTIVDPFSTLSEWGDSDGHTGYFIPFIVGDRWSAYHLHGGGIQPKNPGFALSHSLDGRSWVTDPRFLKFDAHMLLTTTFRIEWNTCTPFLWRGRLWVAGLYSDGTSGGGAKNARLFIAPLSSNFRHVLAPPTLILPPQGIETVNYQSALLYSEAGTLYLYYQCDENFFVATAAG